MDELFDRWDGKEEYEDAKEGEPHLTIPALLLVWALALGMIALFWAGVVWLVLAMFT